MLRPNQLAICVASEKLEAMLIRGLIAPESPADRMRDVSELICRFRGENEFADLPVDLRERFIDLQEATSATELDSHYLATVLLRLYLDVVRGGM